jgi:hypothetical protein
MVGKLYETIRTIKPPASLGFLATPVSNFAEEKNKQCDLTLGGFAQQIDCPTEQGGENDN